MKSGLSVRLRLTLLYTLVFGLSLVASNVLVYVSLERYLSSQLDHGLAGQAAEIAGTSRVDLVVTGGGTLGLNVVLPDLDVFAEPGLYVEVINRGGQVQARSGNLGQATLPVSQASFLAALGGGERLETVSAGAVRLRSYYLPLRVRTDVVGVLIVARSRQDLDDALGRLRFAFGAFGLAGLAVASLAGWLLARTALRPIDRLTRTARAIGEARDLSRRVGETDRNDEVGRLAATFNEMLERLESAQAELAQALSAEQRFVADASHELRTPLSTVRANLELLQRVDDLAPADREAALADSVAEIERLGRLVADLLTLARADAGLHLARQPVDLAALLRDVYRQARLLAIPRAQRVTLDEPPACRLDGNTDALRQLILILVDNGLKYSPDGGQVRLRLDHEGTLARLTVADDGPGISPEALPHIFERFYRADPARSGGGTGLGLAIARWIVDEHGGDLRVTSRPAVGSTFTVELPRLAP